jgi:ABC-type branched-subunit amino acid transport system ATPase component
MEHGPSRGYILESGHVALAGSSAELVRDERHRV